jgi:hypothetical protein
VCDIYVLIFLGYLVANVSARAVLVLFQARDLDAYFSLEETLLTRGAQDRDSILELIGAILLLRGTFFVGLFLTSNDLIYSCVFAVASLSFLISIIRVFVFEIASTIFHPHSMLTCI